MSRERDETRATPPDPAAAPGAASIVQIYGGELGRRHALIGEVTIGREEPCSVVVDQPSVSRQHARLFLRDGNAYVVDLRSTNGTLVNGRRAAGEEPLKNGDLLKLGGAVFKFLEGGNIEALYHEEMYRLAIRDGLTGLNNKRYFLEFLRREAARASRHCRPLSLAMMDVDNFKAVNDRYGHQAGDHVLQRLAAVVEATIREEELVARYGGEEFAFVLPETDERQARVTCERARRLVEEQVFEFDAETIRVTVSLGVAAFDPSGGTEELIAAADAAVYRAKAEGRNRIVVAEARAE